jgi:hypothetical protein
MAEGHDFFVNERTHFGAERLVALSVERRRETGVPIRITTTTPKHVIKQRVKPWTAVA